MAAASPIQTAFNSGELSPLLAGRVDFQKYVNGCKTMQNFTPKVQGPAQNRPGFHYVSNVADSLKRTWLVPFVFSETVGFVLEFGDGYIRFYVEHGQLIVGGVPYQIATPYATSDMINPDGSFALSFAQSGDVIYIANANHPPQKLIRLSNTSWTIGPVPFTSGPFLPINPNNTITVTNNTFAGAITLTASAPLFGVSDVGTKFYLQYPLNPATPIIPWSSGLAVATNTFVYSGLNYYENTGAPGTTGSIQPIHEQGTKSDGVVNWTYFSSGYAVVTITGFTSPTLVSATVDPGYQILPSSGTSATTTLWAKSQWGTTNGYPTVVTFFRGRLVWAQGSQIFFSVAADYENMATEDHGVVADDMAIIINIASDRFDAITWMAPADVLLVGTVGSEYAVAEANTSQPFGPSNIQAKQQTGNGGRAIQPIVFNSSTLFVQRAGKQLREMRYSFATNNYQSIDLAVLSEHITQGQIINMDFQQQPDYIVWCVLFDGQLVGLTYCREQDTVGWHEHVLGGGAIVEAVACIPRPDGTGDELWAILNVQIQGTQQRFVAWLDPGWDATQPLSSAFYMDLGSTFNGTNLGATTLTIADTAGTPTWNFPDPATVTASASYFTADMVGSSLLFTSGSDQVIIRVTGFTDATHVTGVIQSLVPVAIRNVATVNWSLQAITISGLTYLAGETVTILGDGAPQASQVVSNTGKITLEYPAAIVQVGLGYTSTLTTMRFTGGGQTGPGQGMLKRISHAIFRFFNTLGGSYGSDGGPYDDIQWRSSFDPMNQPPPPFTGDVKVEWNNGTDFDGYVSIQQRQPLPMTVVAVMPQFFTNDPQT